MKISNAKFLKYMTPVLQALNELGGSGTPDNVKQIIKHNKNISDEAWNETIGASNTRRISNQIDWARNYLVYAGYLNNNVRGIWSLTDKAKNHLVLSDEETTKILNDYQEEYRNNKQNKEENMNSEQDKFDWIDFYSEFANKLLAYKDNRIELIEKIKSLYQSINKKLPTLEDDNLLNDIDPFTIFGLFNKYKMSGENKIEILKQIKSVFSISSKVPKEFNGIPTVMDFHAAFYAFGDKKGVNDINNLWEIFEIAIKLSDNYINDYKNDFIKLFNKVTKQKEVNFNLTMGLFWIRPYTFISLDGTNRGFFKSSNNSFENIFNIFGNIKKLPNGETYLNLCDEARNEIQKVEYPFHDFPSLSYYAWKNSNSTEISKEDNVTEINDEEINDSLTIPQCEPYTRDNFLSEVYIDENKYNTLVGLLNTKLNVILQGAPGVGKTFVAKRLAYSIMGEKDDSRIAMVQFHQSYGYEDFIQGYRPTENGFKLTNGVFYNFCKKAEEDIDRPYFFIIDEINRGNLSKIFGELMMLIEYDKRGESLKLLYNDELFCVPKNIRIIGTMNTADRSLAIIDYALRRRFSFYEFEPAFSNDKFKNYVEEKHSEKFEKLVQEIERINSKIEKDSSLGKGFKIGHSYFCFNEEITDTRLSAIVEYEIIPLLQEYWFDDNSTVDEISAELWGAIK